MRKRKSGWDGRLSAGETSFIFRLEQNTPGETDQWMPSKSVMTLTPKLGLFLLELGEIAKAESGARPVEKLHDLEERYGYWSGSPEENAAVGIELI